MAFVAGSGSQGLVPNKSENLENDQFIIIRRRIVTTMLIFKFK